MISKRRIFLYIGLAISVILILYFIYHNRVKLTKIFIPFLMALVIAYLLNPLIVKLRRRKISCTVSILLIYSFFLLGIGAVILFIVPELINNTRELMATLPDITARYQAIFNNFMASIQSSNWAPDIKNAIFNEMQNNSSNLQAMILNTLRSSLYGIIETVSAMFDLVLAMIIAYYFIKDANFFKESVLALSPRKWRNGLINAGREVNMILSNFIQGQMLTALIVGSLETIGLFIVNVKYPVILGLIGGIANIIPYFGPILGAIPAVAIALIDSPAKAGWVALVFIIVQQLDNAFISPKIIEGKLGLHPVSTILAVLIGGEFLGIPGMLLAVPSAAILKAITKRLIEAIV